MSCDHIAVEIDGNMQGPGAPLCGPVCAKSGGGNIDDGGTYAVDIAWDASAQQLAIYFDGSLRLTCNNDFVTNAFAGNSQVYWGATSATGGLNNQQYFCPSSVVILPVELTSFSSNCDGIAERFEWITATEERTDYFQLEYTYDGIVFYPEGIVDAAGQSQQKNFYSFIVNNEDPALRYYRLKIVDENGDFQYTDLITSQRCAFPDELISGVMQDASTLMISTQEAAEISIYNAMGQLLFSTYASNDGLSINKAMFSEGIYFILAQNQKGKQQSRRVFIRK